MMILSLIMIVNPNSWVDGIVKFSQKSWFHPFEILSRLAFGLIFIFFAHQTLYPKFMSVIGYVLVAVSVGLLLTKPSKHKEFAVWSAEKFKNYFRWLGFISLAFGAFLIYAAIWKLL